MQTLSVMWWLASPLRYGSFRKTKGINQGCLASGILFAVAIDPVIRYLAALTLSPSDVIRGYADDLAMA